MKDMYEGPPFLHEVHLSFITTSPLKQDKTPPLKWRHHPKLLHGSYCNQLHGKIHLDQMIILWTISPWLVGPFHLDCETFIEVPHHFCLGSSRGTWDWFHCIKLIHCTEMVRGCMLAFISSLPLIHGFVRGWMYRWHNKLANIFILFFYHVMRRLGFWI